MHVATRCIVNHAGFFSGYLARRKRATDRCTSQYARIFYCIAFHIQLNILKMSHIFFQCGLKFIVVIKVYTDGEFLKHLNIFRQRCSHISQGNK